MSTNGTGRPPEDDEKIVKFPTLADRDRARKEQLKREAIHRKHARAGNANVPPFFNFGKIPTFTKFMAVALLVINAPLFLMSDWHVFAIFNFGFVPSGFTDGTLSLQTLVTIFSHVFIHGDVMHLAFNLVMMVALGMFFEKTMGFKQTIQFFILCCLAGAATYFVLAPFSPAPMVGASGGISGFFAAILMVMHGQGRMGRFGRLAQYGYWPIVGFWLVLMLGIGALSGANVAWQAHTGGYVAGALLFHFWVRQV